MTEETLVHDSALIQLLRGGDTEGFNQRAKMETLDLKNANLRLADLRGHDLRTADLSGAYLRNADLRGVDLSEANLAVASIHDAQISGTLFPENLAPEEIMLSITHGCRIRVKKTVEFSPETTRSRLLVGRIYSIGGSTSGVI